MGEQRRIDDGQVKDPLSIYALALTSFALGTAEFAPNGQLTSVSDGFSVPVADAGLITTGFAVGAFVGGPLIAAATLRVPHKRLAVNLVWLFGAAAPICDSRLRGLIDQRGRLDRRLQKPVR